jgi:hypothetical protein
MIVNIRIPIYYSVNYFAIFKNSKIIHSNIRSFSYYSQKYIYIRQIEKSICRLVDFLKSTTLILLNEK